MAKQSVAETVVSHTPGPWAVIETPTTIGIRAEHEQMTVAEMHKVNIGPRQSEAYDEAMRDAYLIACAPDMLAALKAFVALPASDGAGYLDFSVTDLQRAVNQALAVIARADSSSGLPVAPVGRTEVPKSTGTVSDLLDLLGRMHERLTDGRSLPEWMSGWVEEIDAVMARAEGRAS